MNGGLPLSLVEEGREKGGIKRGGLKSEKAAHTKKARVEYNFTSAHTTTTPPRKSENLNLNFHHSTPAPKN